MYKFSNFPTYVPLEQYEKELSSFIKEAVSLFGDDIVSIYQIGECELPGVSDIDLLMVYCQPISKKALHSILQKFPLIDTPILLDSTSIESFARFTHHQSIQRVYGDDLGLENIKNSREITIIHAWKVLSFSCLRNFYIPLSTGEINVKQLLSHIYDVRYVINNFKRVFPNENIDLFLEFLKEFSDFRRNWFKNPDTMQLASFLIESIDICWGLIEIFNRNVPVQRRDVSDFIYGRYPTIFTQVHTFNDYRRLTELYYVNFYKKDRFLTLPPTFNQKNWSPPLKDGLQSILNNNPDYLRLGFNAPSLKLALLIKKFFDFIKLHLFTLYAKI